MYSNGGMKNAGSNFFFGAALLVFSVIELAQSKLSIGIVLLVIGIYYLVIGSRQQKAKKNGTPVGKESALQRQAFAPDAKRPEQMCEPLDTKAPESAWDGTKLSCEEPEATQKYGYKQNQERLDELKGLYEGGILTEEEYQERLAKVARRK